MEFIASAAFGLESVVESELKKIGCPKKKVENGKIYFDGQYQDMMRANLWLRCANRIFINMGEFEAKTFEELFQGVKAMPWEDILPSNASFPVLARSVKSQLHSVPDCQAIGKKAIVERLKSKYNINWFKEDGPKYTIEISILSDKVTVTIDTSGSSLHQRGYREDTGMAPIKETLACGMIMLSYWKPDMVLLDPFCGTGTIPIEAAMIGLNIAPGLKRNFAFEKWGGIDLKAWNEIKAEAAESVIKDAELRIYGSDINYFALKLAMNHALKAGVDKYIRFQKLDFRSTSSRFKKGFIITNPPYGERIKADEGITQLYKDMGKHFKSFEGWCNYIITPFEGFEKTFGKKADKIRKLYNGNIKCNYYQYFKQ